MGVAKRAHHGRRVRFEQFHGQIDGLARDFRFVALHIDEHIDIGNLAGGLGDAVGSGQRTSGW